LPQLPAQSSIQPINPIFRLIYYHTASTARLVQDALLKAGLALLIALLPFAPALRAQHTLFRELRENPGTERAFYFYPSTLRMINLSGNPDFDELMSEVEKLVVYDFDSAQSRSLDLNGFRSSLLTQSFEEWMSVRQEGMDIQVYGLDRRRKNPEMIAIVRSDGEVMMVDLIGLINPVRLPELIRNFDSGQFLNVFEPESGKKTADGKTD
jgi:hypothetical protein